MTYDEWKASQSPTPSPNGLQLGGVPDPPFLNRPDLAQHHDSTGRARDWWKYMNTPQPLPKGITDWWKWMNTPLGANDPMGPRPTTNPSFYPMQGEKLALQMPGVNKILNRSSQGTVPLPGYRDETGQYRKRQPYDVPMEMMQPSPSLRQDFGALKDRLLSGYADPPVGMREMPRAPGVPFVPERNTQVIAGPPQPQSTPYPRPPWYSFRTLDGHRRAGTDVLGLPSTGVLSAALPSHDAAGV